jgi:glucose/arabinose dehydrogenase
MTGVRAIVWGLLLMAGCRGARAGDGCTLVTDDFGPDGKVPFRVETVVDGLEVPWGLAFLPSGDFLLTERPGRVRVVREGKLLEKPLLSVGSATGEGGLLGIALDPRFFDNRRFYLYRTTEQNGRRLNRVERWNAAPDFGSATFEHVVLQDIPGARYHDGGRLRFGRDGYLYIGTGDATQPKLAQDPQSYAGKILRVTTFGEVPRDNPAPNNPAFIFGVRNVEAFDWFDAQTLLVIDHGPSGELGRTGHDEYSVARAGDNLGWPTIYGCQRKSRLVTPVLTWNEAVPPGGAAIYTGTAIPEWKGDLLIGTLGSRHLHRVAFGSGNPEHVRLHEVYLRGDPPTGFGRLRDVVMGPDRQLYVTTSNCDGRGTCPARKDAVLRITR